MVARSGVQLGMSHRNTNVVDLLALEDAWRCLGVVDDLSTTSPSTTTSPPFILFNWRSHHTWTLNPRLRARGHLTICEQTNGQRISIRLTAPKSRQQGDSPCRGIAMKHGIEVYSSVISRAAGKNHHAPGQSAVSCWPIRISLGHKVARGPFEQKPKFRLPWGLPKSF